MWYIDTRGTARAEYDGGRKIVVRTTTGKQNEGPWHIIIQGDPMRMPLTYKTRDEAMAAAEWWVQRKNLEA